MSALKKDEPEHRAYLCLGSNIEPAAHLREAIRLLGERTRLLALSTCWETQAVGTSGPNFLNMAACVATTLEPDALKETVLRPLEQELGRVRTADKYAPRTIDLDITLFDGLVLDPELWRRDYLALVFAELLPDLRNPESGETLREAAQRVISSGKAVPCPGIDFRWGA